MYTAGGAGAGLLMTTAVSVLGPVLIPATVAVIPIHMYNKYTWEKSVKNLK